MEAKTNNLQFNHFPAQVQQRIKCLLSHNEFIQAKVLYDAWANASAPDTIKVQLRTVL